MDHRAMADAACLNCGTPLAGWFCHGCGQNAAVHRSLLHLGGELLETVTHADSRFWRTLRRLALDPARLSRDYIEGRRAREIPPLRLFFVTLFLLFGIGSLTAGRIEVRLDATQRGVVDHYLDRLRIDGEPEATQLLRQHLHRAADRPDEVLAVMRNWSERFTVLLLPLAGAMLWLLHLPGRGHTLFDHMIVSIHSLCFASLVLMALFLLGTVTDGVAGLVLLLLPAHLFGHLRGVYRTSVVGTLLRMAVLFLATVVAAVTLLLVLAAVGLALGTRG